MHCNRSTFPLNDPDGIMSNELIDWWCLGLDKLVVMVEPRVSH